MELPRDVVLLSTADWAHPFATNKQRMAASLAARGMRVLYVESQGLRRPAPNARDARRIAARVRRALAGLTRPEPGIWVHSPLLVPLHGLGPVRRANRGLLAWSLRRHMRRLGFGHPLLWTYTPTAADLVTDLDPAMVVYHCVDDLSAAPLMPAEALRRAEEDLLRRADAVFVTSPALEARCAAIRPDRTWRHPNVADFDHFSRAREAGPLPADLAAIPEPRLGYVGAISPYKLDFELLRSVAARRPEWHWVLIGEVGEGQPGASAGPLRLPNVHLLGPRRYADLPDYLRGLAVATIPAPANPYTAAMFPMKFFEYLSAGRPVVASDLPALREYSHLCRLTRSAEEFASAVEAALAGRGADPAAVEAAARKHTWEWRTSEMLARLEERWERMQGR